MSIYTLHFKERGRWIKSVVLFRSRAGAERHADLIGARTIRIRIKHKREAKP